ALLDQEERVQQQNEEGGRRERIAEEPPSPEEREQEARVVGQEQGEPALEERHESAHVQGAAAHVVGVLEVAAPPLPVGDEGAAEAAAEADLLGLEAPEEHPPLKKALVLPGQHPRGPAAVMLAAQALPEARGLAAEEPGRDD